ncbi:cytoplasmic 60S subunit biogenesis factor Rei1p [Trichomonascus vanleenenianus]|uniref:cytoplasmic 60S subunit biogenesis factor Rei1p n=1 Tax=Trichomonascus vanleenenianus TaxID=2268995 RepID=UPI003ECAFCA1
MDINENTRAPEGVFTCNTCGLSFPTADLQRLHMRTDWHRYNLKRRVAQLPPISSELFAEKMLQQQQIQQMEQEKTGRGSSGRSTGQRQVTKKDKKREEKLLRKQAAENNRRKYENSIPERPGSPVGSVGSGISSAMSLGDPMTESAQVEFDRLTLNSSNGDVEMDGSVDDNMSTAGMDSENEEEVEIKRRLAKAVHFPTNVCFVDNKKFDSVEDNVEYMRKSYGLFIPEREYLVDLDGLIKYLGEKIGLGNMCLACSYEGRTVQAVQQHMISKSHVRIPYETTAHKLEVSDFYDFRSSYATSRRIATAEGDEDEWEDVDEDEEMVGSDDEEVGDEEGAMYVDETGYELSLGTGYRAGHRTLVKYYRQNLRPSRITREGQGTVMAVDTRSAHGLVSRDPVQDKQIKQAWKEEKKARNLYIRRDKFINNQPHYRDELLQ